MRVLGYGAGAVGSLLSGYLSAGGCEVTLLCRPQQAEAIAKEGLTITLPGNKQIHATNISVLRHLSEWRGDPPQVIVVAVKSYDNGAVAEDIKKHFGQSGIILTVQNGVGNEEYFAGHFGYDRIFSAALTLSVSQKTGSVVRQNTVSGGLGLAAVDPRARDVISLLQQSWQRAGLHVDVYPSYKALKWSKLLINLFGNATAAILDMPPSEMARYPRLFAIELEQVRECLRVMSKQHIELVNLPGFPVRLLKYLLPLPDAILYRLLRKKLIGGRGSKMPSLWVDLERGRSNSEVHVLNGAVVRAGAEYGIHTPANDLLYNTLCAILDGTLPRYELRGQPERLIQMLHR